MPRKKAVETPPKESLPTTPPAFSREEREDRLIALAYDVAEKRLLNGTASAQEIAYLLKAGSTRERIERQLMKKQDELMATKADDIKSRKTMEEAYTAALAAMRRYQGAYGDDVDEDL